jgi:lysozyme
MTVSGIDISKWNGNWDAAKAKAAGAAFVFIKASQATFTDPLFKVNWQKAKDAGLLRGAYHYLDYTKPGRDQADYYATLLDADRGELPPVVDYEQRRTDNNVGAARLALRDFLEQLKARGYTPMVYTAPAFWSTYGSTDVYWQQYRLWIAHYTTASAPTVPAPWKAWTFWQYTSKGDGPTYGTESYNVDLNRFNGTLEELYQLAGISIPSGDLESRVAALEQKSLLLEQRVTLLEQRVSALEQGSSLPPSPPPTTDLYATCTASSLNVRSGPGTSYPAIPCVWSARARAGAPGWLGMHRVPGRLVQREIPQVRMTIGGAR